MARECVTCGHMPGDHLNAGRIRIQHGPCLREGCECREYVEPVAVSVREELRDALEDAIRRAYCEPLYPPRREEDPEIVRAVAQAAIITDPAAMRHLARVQAAAWEAVKERVE